jgi:hypothetical protein
MLLYSSGTPVVSSVFVSLYTHVGGISVLGEQSASMIRLLGYESEASVLLNGKGREI